MTTRFLAFLMLAVLALPARALLPDEENTIKVFHEASPSVVFITNVAIGENADMDEYAVPQGAGSGFVWDKDGHIVTNFHVVMGGNAFLVSFDGRHQMNATLVGRDPLHDIAVLKVDKPSGDLTPIKVGSLDRVQVGQTAIAIGNPFGLDHTLTRGTVSALGRQVQGIGGVTIRNMIQTDAAINPGNSGGPLLDSDGQLIGMNTMIYSQSGSSAGIGFAVPVSFIKRIVPQIIEYGRVIRPGMGVSVLTTGQKYYLIGEADGVVINAVERGSPAARAGLRGMRRGPDGYRIGDIIVGIDDIPVKDFDDLFNALDRYKVGDRVKVRFLRDGRERAVRLKLISIQP